MSYENRRTKPSRRTSVWATLPTDSTASSVGLYHGAEGAAAARGLTPGATLYRGTIRIPLCYKDPALGAETWASEKKGAQRVQCGNTNVR